MGWFYLAGLAVTFVLALLGAIVTVFAPPNDAAKALYILLFAVLALASGALSYLEWQENKKDQDSRNAELIDMRASIEKLVELNAPRQIEAIAKSLAELQKPEKPKASGLKHDILELSKSILRFLLDRGEPPLPQSGTWERDTNAMIAHLHETMKLYSLSFAPRVIAARQDLAERGLIDKELDSFYEHPTNPIGIRIVGERLGALAERLPE